MLGRVTTAAKAIAGHTLRLAVALLAGLGTLTVGTGTTAARPQAPHAGAASWYTDAFDAMRTGYNDLETTIGPTNAHAVHELWRDDLGAVMIAQPVEAAGIRLHGTPTSIVYEGTEAGDLYAIRASDGQIIWQRNLGAQTTTCNDMPGGVYGIGGAGVIDRTARGSGLIYVAGGDGAVHALDLATGAERRGWPVKGVFNPARESVYGGLNLFAGRLYVTAGGHCDQTPYSGSVTEIGVAAHSILHRFYPAGRPAGGISGGGVWGPGGASIDPANGDAFVATGNALTTPEDYEYSDGLVQLGPALKVLSFAEPKISGGDMDFGSTPVLFRPPGCQSTLLAALNKSGAMLVYREGKLSSGKSQRLQVAAAGSDGLKGDVAWDPVTRMVYVANSSDATAGPYKHGLVALRAERNCSLRLAWQRSVGPPVAYGLPPPTVANGVVYYGDGVEDTEFAFNASTGKQLWHSTQIQGAVYAASTIVNGRLFVPSWDDGLYAFGTGSH